MVYIVIPVFNRWVYTKACLACLYKQDYWQYKIIVVDHGSTDDTSTLILNEFPEVILVKGDSSLWWTGATNLGVKKALDLSASKNDFVLTLNNDLEVNDNYLTELVKVYDANQPCFVGSVSVDINDPSIVNYIGNTWNSFTARYTTPTEIKYNYNQLVNERGLIMQTSMLTGRGTLIPIKAFDEIGMFDEQNFPHYMADEDFSLRGKNAGYKILIAVRAVVKSHIAATGKKFKFSNKSFSNFTKSLVSIRSPNCIRVRYSWAKKHGKIPAVYFFIDLSRIIFSFLKGLFV